MLVSATQFRQRFNSQKAALAKALLSKSKRSSEAGLSLLECLVAILVVAAVISAITPPIFVTVATRVQNRRAEQAKQLAQAEVDRVRRLLDKGDYSKAELDAIAPQVVGGTGDITNQTVSFEDNRHRVDINGDGKYDFWVQTFRNQGSEDKTDPANPKPVAFNLGVRVYVYFEGEKPTEVQRGSLGMTTATGSQRKRPLAVIYTPVALSDNENSLTGICRLNNECT